MKNLHIKLKQKDKRNKDEAKRKIIISDIHKYLKNQSTFESNQDAIGLHNIFRGIIINNWTDENPTDNTDHKYNRVIVQKSVEYYHQRWKERCEILHDESMQRPRMQEWYQNIVNRVQNSDKYQLKRYVEVRKLNVQTAKTETITEWIKGALKMEKRTSECEHQDIRQWFSTQPE